MTDPFRASATCLGVVVLPVEPTRVELRFALEPAAGETEPVEPRPPAEGGGDGDDEGGGGGGGEGGGDVTGSVTGGGGVGGGTGGGSIEIVVVVIGVDTVTVGSVGRLIAPNPGPVATAASTPAAASARHAASHLSRLLGRTSLELIRGPFGSGLRRGLTDEAQYVLARNRGRYDA